MQNRHCSPEVTQRLSTLDTNLVVPPSNSANTNDTPGTTTEQYAQFDSAKRLPPEPRLEFKASIAGTNGNWYRVVEKLGAGGSAVTYLVLGTEGQVNGSLFAMKMFRSLVSESRRHRFLKETKFLKLNNHPSIMALRDFSGYTIRDDAGTAQSNIPFFIADYLPFTLYDVIRENRSTFVEKASYVVQLLSALDHISNLSSPVIHRDIKPQNIFVKGRTCLLGDFGLMTRATPDHYDDRGVLSESQRPGIPWYYRTPDLVAFEKHETPLTPASDVFQLGLVATLLFTGRNPCIPTFNLLDDIRLERIGVIPTRQGKGVFMLLKRMLEFDPAKRPTARQLLDPWRDVFWDAARVAIDLNGYAF